MSDRSTPPYRSVIDHVAVNEDLLYNDNVYDQHYGTPPRQNIGEDSPTPPPTPSGIVQEEEQEDEGTNILINPASKPASRPPSEPANEPAHEPSPPPEPVREPHREPSPPPEPVHAGEPQHEDSQQDEPPDFSKMSAEELERAAATLTGSITPKPLDQWDGNSPLLPIPDDQLHQMTQPERWAYVQSLKQLKKLNGGKFPNDEFDHSYATISVLVNWQPSSDRRVQDLSTIELQEYEEELMSMDLRYYNKGARVRIQNELIAIDNKIEADEALAQGVAPPTPKKPVGKGKGPATAVGKGKGPATVAHISAAGDPGSPDGSGSSDGDDDDDNGGARHKNVDQDSVAKARQTRLGKGDYQTIAETTTVTTVRRGKRPVVDRQHHSTTLPSDDGGDDGDDDGDDAGAGPSKRKRKSRVPKTKAIRRRIKNNILS